MKNGGSQTTAILLSIGIVVALACHRTAPNGHTLDPVTVGATEAEVRAALGKPDVVVEPRPSHWCDNVPVAEQHATPEDRVCVRQWIYRRAVATCDSVCFGTSGKVIGTYHYVSP